MGRGVYRGVYSSLFDDPDYQRLTPNARLVLVTARQSSQSGPAAIYRYYTPVLAQQTGLSDKQVEAGLDELEEGGWVCHDAAVLWVKNGLRYDPNMTLANPKHRAHIERWLAGLPRSPIILKCCDYYQIAYPFDTHSIPDPIQSPPSRSRSRRTNPPVSPHRGDAIAVLDFLNQKTGRSYAAMTPKGEVTSSLRLIEARLADGATVENCRGVIARKVRQWAKDPKMALYLRPMTLFRQSNFEQYLGEREQENAHGEAL